MDKIFKYRFDTAHLEEYLGRVDEKWSLFFDNLFNDPQYQKVLKEAVMVCNQCARYFLLGKNNQSRLSELTFKDLYEFNDEGGDRYRFSEFCWEDDEGKTFL